MRKKKRDEMRQDVKEYSGKEQKREEPMTKRAIPTFRPCTVTSRALYGVSRTRPGGALFHASVLGIGQKIQELKKKGKRNEGRKQRQREASPDRGIEKKKINVSPMR